MEIYVGEVAFIAPLEGDRNGKKGYGFIKADGVEGSVFFHAKDLRDVAYGDLSRGTKVVFDELITNSRGHAAKSVRLAH